MEKNEYNIVCHIKFTVFQLNKQKTKLFIDTLFTYKIFYYYSLTKIISVDHNLRIHLKIGINKLIWIDWNANFPFTVTKWKNKKQNMSGALITHWFMQNEQTWIENMKQKITISNRDKGCNWESNFQDHTHTAIPDVLYINW